MSLLSSFIIDPVVRQARRFSGVSPPAEASSNDDVLSPALSHVSSTSTDDALNTPPERETSIHGPTTPDAPAVPAVEQRPHYLIDRFRRYSSFSRQAQDAVEEEDDNGIPSPTIIAPVAVPASISMPRAPSRILDDELRQLTLDPLPSSAPAAPSTLASRPAALSRNATALSESLPADDGMAHLRTRIHEIRDLKISDQERARMVHSLMTERYHYMRPTSPSSFVSHDRPFTPNSSHSVFSETQVSSPSSAPSDVDPENPYNLRPGDTSPTFRLQRPHEIVEHGEEEEEDEEVTDGEATLGCQHYKRNVKVQCFECRHWYTCRHCHDAVEDHSLNRKQTQNMLCMVCGTPQQANNYCRNCQTEAACYYCDICKLWDNNRQKKIYHCPDCGICRKGEGLGKEFYHCKSCNVCIAIAHATTHKCHPGAIENDCPICSDDLFDSASAVVSMPCGHYLHKGCYNLYMETAYKCPICKKSAVSMDLQWRKLTHAIEGQPMPDQFSNTRAIVQCNDCSAKSSVKYHWLGNQCSTCESYNTNELRILNGPQSEETANAILDADVDDGLRSPASVSSPTSIPLRSPRYYFQPDEPEQTWLPAQLPAFPFQMPQFPGRPRMPQMPQMPQFPSLPQFPQFPQMPQFPQIPQLPQMPQMPEAAQELLERVRKSMDSYLNPTGDVRVEDVPFIDLGEDDRRERRATDGTTVKEPSLPQYVVERFTQSLQRFRDDLNPGLEEIPTLDLTEDHEPDGLQFWGEDGGRLQRMISHVEEDEEEETSSDESEHEEDEDDDEEDDEEGMDAGRKNKEWDLPGHR